MITELNDPRQNGMSTDRMAWTQTELNDPRQNGMTLHRTEWSQNWMTLNRTEWLQTEWHDHRQNGMITDRMEWSQAERNVYRQNWMTLDRTEWLQTEWHDHRQNGMITDRTEWSQAERNDHRQNWTITHTGVFLDNFCCLTSHTSRSFQNLSTCMHTHWPHQFISPECDYRNKINSFKFDRHSQSSCSHCSLLEIPSTQSCSSTWHFVDASVLSGGRHNITFICWAAHDTCSFIHIFQHKDDYLKSINCICIVVYVTLSTAMEGYYGCLTPVPHHTTPHKL